MALPSELDPKAVRRQFARRALTLQDADYLYREIERRMLERLPLVRIAPRLVVDVGCGLGSGTMALRQRFPEAGIVGVDFALPVLRAARTRLRPARTGLLSRLRARSTAPEFACADAASLPLRRGAVGLVWSNAALHWTAEPARVLAEWARVLEPGGLLMFSTFGPDTLAELRRAGIDTMRFADMHDVGDALVAAGFAEPVMDVERIEVVFRSAKDLLHDLRALGGNALRARKRGLASRTVVGRRATELVAASGEGGFRVGFEIVYGLAWGGRLRRAGESPITIHRRVGGP